MTMLATLLSIHFVGDFLLQSDWMALGKSKEWKPLLAHVGVYSMCFACFGLPFAIVTFLLHLVVDYLTSRLTSRLWFLHDLGECSDFEDGFNTVAPYKVYDMLVYPGRRHWFFVAIGLDQLIHVWCLALTYRLLIG